MEYLGYSIPLLILALVSVANKVGYPRKYSTILAVFLGVLVETVFIYPNDLKTGVFMGIVIGLSASGLYSGAKNVCVGDDCKPNGNGKTMQP